VINSGIGDSDMLATRERVGALVGELDHSGYAAAVNDALSFIRNPEESRRRSRAAAERLFNLQTVGDQSYARLYESVLAG
jgi:glycogen synthase